MSASLRRSRASLASNSASAVGSSSEAGPLLLSSSEAGFLTNTGWISTVFPIAESKWLGFQCCGSGSEWICIKLKGTVGSGSASASKWSAESGTGSASICRWQAKMYEIWDYLSTFSRFWALEGRVQIRIRIRNNGFKKYLHYCQFVAGCLQIHPALFFKVPTKRKIFSNYFRFYQVHLHPSSKITSD